MGCAVLSEHWNQRPDVPKLRSLPLFLHFYSSARLKLVLLICFIFSLFALQFVVLLSVWSCILYLRFDSKNCPNCCSVVALQGCRSLQGEGNFFCKGGRVLACVANCPGSGVTVCYRPVLRFPCPHTCFLSQLTH